MTESHIPDIPIFTDIHTDSLLKDGWERKGNATYTKGDDIIKYDGCYWFLNGNCVNYIQDLKTETK